MRGGSNLKNFIIAGLIAGIASGIVFTIFNISCLWELFSILPLIWPAETLTIASLHNSGLYLGHNTGSIFRIFL